MAAALVPGHAAGCRMSGTTADREQMSDATLLAAVSAQAPMPWRTNAQAECGVLFDAEQAPVVIADVWGDAPDHDVFLITLLIQRAVSAWVARVQTEITPSKAA